MMLAMTAQGSKDEKAPEDKTDKPEEKKDSGNYVGKLTPRF